MREQVVKRYPDLSIFHRLLFGFFAISVFIILVGGTVYYYYARQRVTQFQQREMQHSLQNALAYFNNKYNSPVTTDLLLLEAAPALDNFLSVRKEELPLVRFDIEKMFFRLSQVHVDLYKAIMFFDAYGQEKIVIRNHKRERDYSSVVQYKERNDPLCQGMAQLFERLKESSPGSILFEGPFKDSENNSITAIGISKREPEIAGFGGVIMLLCDITGYFSYLSNIKVFDTPVAWVYSENGDILLSPPHSENQPDPRHYAEGVHSNEISFHTHGNYVQVFCTGCTLGSDDKNIFRISFTLPPRIHTSLMKEIIDRALFVTSIILIITILVSFILSKQFSKPIIELSRASQLIGKGELPETTIIEGGGEIGELSRSFYNMAVTLHKSIEKRDQEIFQRKVAEKSLQQAHDELEQRVEERTRELKKTHEQLLHSEKLSAIGQLSASIAHEFNNPLAGILNVINGLKRRASYDEADAKLIDMALEEGERMKNLIKSLQDFNRPTSGIFAPIDLHATIDSLLILGKNEFRKKRITVERNYADNIPQIRAVADQLKQVILNLLNNAVYACDNGGTIAISTGVTAENLFVRIQDTGKGIHPENLPHIFEPFYTTKPEVKGTGLGLSISYGIIKRHGGSIDVNSEIGKGSTFTVTLPLQGGMHAEQNSLVSG